MTSPYLKLAQNGRNKWWYYGLSLIVFPAIAFLITFFILGMGIALYSLLWQDEQLRVAFSSREAIQTLIYSAPGWAIYCLLAVAVAVPCLALIASIERLHQRRILTVISADQIFRFQRFWSAFGVWLLFVALSYAIGYFISPQNYQVALEPAEWLLELAEWLVCLPFALLFAGLFALISELARGYLLQGLGLLIHQPTALVSLSALLVAVVFFTPNQPLYLLPMFAFGIGLATFILKDNRLEIALGIQAAAQFSIVLVYPLSGLNKPNVPTMLISDPSSPGLRLIWVLIGLGIVYSVFFRRSAPPGSAESNEE